MVHKNVFLEIGTLKIIEGKQFSKNRITTQKYEKQKVFIFGSKVFDSLLQRAIQLGKQMQNEWYI